VLPNPSSGEATFLLGRGSSGTGQLTIFRSDGRVVREYPAPGANSGASSGASGLRWDGHDAQDRAVPPGIYFYRWRSGTELRRGTLVRTR
jgi:hypothetical protein